MLMCGIWTTYLCIRKACLAFSLRCFGSFTRSYCFCLYLHRRMRINRVPRPMLQRRAAVVTRVTIPSSALEVALNQKTRRDVTIRALWLELHRRRSVELLAPLLVLRINRRRSQRRKKERQKLQLKVSRRTLSICMFCSSWTRSRQSQTFEASTVCFIQLSNSIVIS